jgi:cytochrome c556
MRLSPVLATLTGAVTLVGGLALAQEALPPEEAHEVRSEHMKAFGASLRTLGGMAQGEAPYDAAAAQAAADSLLEHATSPDWAVMWPEGSAQGELEDSKALPAIWENPEDLQAKHQALIDAATAMQGAAGTDLAAVQASLGAVGASCGGCHETYRAADD